MKQDQDQDCNKKIKASIIHSRNIIGNNNSIISNTNNTKNQQNHNRTKSSQSCAELEHVPSHGCTRSMHTQQQQWKNHELRFHHKIRYSSLFTNKKSIINFPQKKQHIATRTTSELEIFYCVTSLVNLGFIENFGDFWFLSVEERRDWN